MLLCFILVLSATPPPAGAPTTPKVVAQAERGAAQALERALKDKSPEVRLAAVQSQVGVSDARGVSLVVKALRDKDRAVRAAAIEALRFSTHPKALAGLHKMAKGKKPLRDDPETHAALLRAIGQHGSTSSIPVLVSELLVLPDRSVTRAGILSIANIRSEKSVSALISLMRSAGRNDVQAHMRSLRMALVVLTGKDQGLSQDAWTTWWNDEKHRLEISSNVPPLAPVDRRTWERHWGILRRVDRVLRRHERGSGDPE